MFSAVDHAMMARALRLAARGLHSTQPNPRVGCVIARDGAVVGEGWHRRAGEAHAEVFALQAARERARGATAYVTLEPCGTFGRTPPCADALIAAGVARVVIASGDSSQAKGDAVGRMLAAGIVVESGLMRTAARELNRGFFKRIEHGLPWLRIKLASGIDGRTALANGVSKWITGEAARRDVQRWRARSSALLTGIGTVLADDPRLTVRDEELLAADPAPVAPLRVVLDSELATPDGAAVLDGSAPTLVVHANGLAATSRFARVECASVPRALHGRGLDMGAVLRLLAGRGMNEVQVEAGARLCGALAAAGFMDELLLYQAPLVLGDDARPLLRLPVFDRIEDAPHLRVHEMRQVGDDVRFLLRPAAARTGG